MHRPVRPSEEVIKILASYTASGVFPEMKHLLDAKINECRDDLEVADSSHFQRIQGKIEALRDLKNDIGKLC